MKKNKLWKIIWVVGIYAILTTILYLVVLYKVEWEYKDLNTYLYFYSCNDDLCTSTTVQEDYYSKVLCENDICPFVIDIIDDNLILKKENTSWIYNYLTGNIINNNYKDYRYLDDDIFVFTDNSSKQGIINLTGEVLVEAEYEYIADYNNNLISYRENNLYGIKTIDGNIKVDANFDNIVLINDKMYAGMKENIYHIYLYENNNYINSNEYHFLTSFDDIIMVINNKKLDILTTDLNSTLLMKINTFYDYSTEKERDSLNLYFDGEYVYFDIFTNENEYSSYKYSISGKRFV